MPSRLPTTRPFFSRTFVSRPAPRKPKEDAGVQREHRQRSPSYRVAQLLYEDRGLVAINKPPRLITQSDKSFQERTGDACAFTHVREDVKNKLSLSQMPLQIHRLDKLTTGVLLLGKSSGHTKNIMNAFKHHEISKTYLALVRGKVKDEDPRSGVIKTPLMFEDGWVRLATDAERTGSFGKEAVTKWEVLACSDVAPLSLVKLNPLSGLKHQLRVHLADGLKMPILGDIVHSKTQPHADIRKLIPQAYSVSPGRRDAVESAKNRTFLHAASLQLHRHRTTGRPLQVKIYAPLPRYFLDVCDAAGLSKFIPGQYITGGLVIDGLRVRKGETFPSLEARWLGEEGEYADGVSEWIGEREEIDYEGISPGMQG